MSNFSKNLRHIRKLNDWSQEQLSIELDITRARVGSYEEGRSEPGIEALIHISKVLHVSIDNLLKHDLTKSKQLPSVKIGNDRLLFPIVVDSEDNDLIEIISARASAGYLNGYADPEFIESLQKMKLPFVPAGKHRAFPIKGDSMPPLNTGSYVIGRYVEDFKDLKEGNTYVVLSKSEGIVYKRIYPEKNNYITLSSDNPQYESYKIHKGEILELWEYTCSIQTGNYKEDELNLKSIMNMLRDLKVELKSIKKKPN